MKPGYRTTEFWIITILSLWSIFSGTVPEPWSVGIPTIASGFYAIARGLAKVGMIKGTVGKDLSKE